MRPMILMVLAGMAGAVPALAQNEPLRPHGPPPSMAPPPTEGRSTVPQAPVGHRQPTPKDLPPDVLRREETGEPQPPTNVPSRPPSICRDC
jgi:hypothetical protein